MAILPPHLLPSAVVAPPSQQVVSGTCWRIQVLSDTVIRLEWDPRGDFVDGPTQMMAQRECVSPKELRIDRDPSGSITIESAHMHFHYDGEAPSSNGVERGDGGQTRNFLGFKVETCEGPAALLTLSMAGANSTEGWSMAGE